MIKQTSMNENKDSIDINTYQNKWNQTLKALQYDESTTPIPFLSPIILLVTPAPLEGFSGAVFPIF